MAIRARSCFGGSRPVRECHCAPNVDKYAGAADWTHEPAAVAVCALWPALLVKELVAEGLRISAAFS